MGFLPRSPLLPGLGAERSLAEKRWHHPLLWKGWPWARPPSQSLMGRNGDSLFLFLLKAKEPSRLKSRNGHHRMSESPWQVLQTVCSMAGSRRKAISFSGARVRSRRGRTRCEQLGLLAGQEHLFCPWGLSSSLHSLLSIICLWLLWGGMTAAEGAGLGTEGQGGRAQARSRAEVGETRTGYLWPRNKHAVAPHMKVKDIDSQTSRFLWAHQAHWAALPWGRRCPGIQVAAGAGGSRSLD